MAVSSRLLLCCWLRIGRSRDEIESCRNLTITQNLAFQIENVFHSVLQLHEDIKIVAWSDHSSKLKIVRPGNDGNFDTGRDTDFCYQNRLRLKGAFTLKCSGKDRKFGVVSGKQLELGIDEFLRVDALVIDRDNFVHPQVGRTIWDEMLEVFF